MLGHRLLRGYEDCYGSYRHNRQRGTMLLSMATQSAGGDRNQTDPAHKLILANRTATSNARSSAEADDCGSRNECPFHDSK